MIKTYLTLLAAILMSFMGVTAQVTTEPTPLQDDSENVVVYFHADQGNKGLANLSSSVDVYAHTGVITSQSSSDSDWKCAPTWGDNSAKYKLEYVSANLYKLSIGSIRDYYGITDPTVTVKKLAFVFRNGDCSKEGKTASGGDIFADVYASGLHVALSSTLSNNVFFAPTKATFTASATQAATITISVGDKSVTKDNVTQLSLDYEFSEYGDYKVLASAKIGDLVSTDEAAYCYPRSSVAANYPGGVPVMGAVKATTSSSDGTASYILCLAAPGKTNVMAVGSWNNYMPSSANVMNYQDYEGYRYFWTTIEQPQGEANNDYMAYYYLVDGSISVGDPYAHLVLDPYNDKYISSEVYPNMPQYPSEITSNVPLAYINLNEKAYNWSVTNFEAPAKEDLLIYELLLRDFTGTEGKANANGTVKLAIEKIPYLKKLGVNAVELLPIMEFNGNNSWGYNPNFYFAPDKAYGTPDDYRRFIDECHKEGMAVILDIVFNQSDGLHPWYQMYSYGQNPFYNANAPHDYSVLNDWNQDCALVQKQFKDALQYWLTEYKVDGFRFDLVKGLGDNNSYSSGTDSYNASRVARMKSLQDAMNEVKPGAYVINENLAGSQEENEMAANGQLNWANINYAAQKYVCGTSSDSNLNRMYAPNDGSRTWGSTVSYLESHDEERLAYVQNNSGQTGVRGNLENSMHRLGSAAAQMILAPGAHMIWQFGELGNYDTTKSGSSNNTDPKTVRWSLLDNADREGLRQNYQELLWLRRSNPDLFTKEATFSMACNSSNWANGRTLRSTVGNKEIITVINPNISGDLTAQVLFKSNNAADYQIISKSYNTEPTFSVSAGTVTVPANSYVCIATTDVSGVESVAADREVAMNVVAGKGIMSFYGESADVCVYDAAGVVRFSGNVANGSVVELPAGIYIVRSNSVVSKVVVR